MKKKASTKICKDYQGRSKMTKKRRSSSASTEPRSSSSRSPERVSGEGVVHAILTDRLLVKDTTTNSFIMSYTDNIQRAHENHGPAEGQLVRYEAIRSRNAQQAGCQLEATFMECVSGRSEEDSSSTESKSVIEAEPETKRIVTIQSPEKLRTHGSPEPCDGRSSSNSSSSYSEDAAPSSKKHMAPPAPVLVSKQSASKKSRSQRKSRSRSRSSRRSSRHSQSPSSEISRGDRLYGRGRIVYAGPKCSLIKDWSMGAFVFFYNVDYRGRGRGDRPVQDGIVDFKALPEKRYIAKHRLTTRWDAVRVEPVLDLRISPDRASGIYTNPSPSPAP